MGGGGEDGKEDEGVNPRGQKMTVDYTCRLPRTRVGAEEVIISTLFSFLKYC